MRSLVDGLHRHRHFALCGGPGTGRTSTLLQVMDLLFERWRRQPGTTKVVPVFVDVAEVVSAGPRFIASHFWQAIVDAVQSPHVHEGAVPPRPRRIDFRRVKDPWAETFEGLEELWANMAGSGAWCRYALLFDQADWLFDPRFEALQGVVAELLSRDGDWTPAASILAGGRALRENLLDQYAPLKFLRPLFLGAFRQSEAQALIKAGLKDVAPQLAETLMTSTGRHPWAMQRVLVEMEQRGPAALGEAIEAATPDLVHLFDRMWAEFDLGRGVTYRGAYAAPEHALMQLLVDFGGGCDLKTAERELGIRPLKEFAEFLEYAGLAERRLVGDFTQLAPQFDLWNVWYGERVLR